ncbi:MAG: hypothetical protein KAR44_14500 [Candidatus Aegiribacteria sp.]|nr:hypothetical protein [Candidatus Aegiribacteria sp.]
MNKKSLISRIAPIAFLTIIFCGCGGNGTESLSEISRRRQCRASLNTLCTDQATYCDANGDWAPNLDLLNHFARRTRPLTCPESGEEFILESSDYGYVLSCPAGHGSIDTGSRSWTGGY